MEKVMEKVMVKVKVWDLELELVMVKVWDLELELVMVKVRHPKLFQHHPLNLLPDLAIQIVVDLNFLLSYHKCIDLCLYDYVLSSFFPYGNGMVHYMGHHLHIQLPH